MMLALLALSQTAHAASTCDGVAPELCCPSWAIDVIRGDKIAGAIIEPNYASLVKAYNAALRTDKILCSYWKDASSCSNSYGEARCANVDEAVVKDTKEKISKMATSAARKAAIAKAASDAVRQAKSQSKRIGQIIAHIERIRKPIPSGENNPYDGLGTSLREYSKVLGDAVIHIDNLQRQFKLDGVGDFGYGLGSERSVTMEDMLLGIARLMDIAARVESFPDRLDQPLLVPQRPYSPYNFENERLCDGTKCVEINYGDPSVRRGTASTEGEQDEPGRARKRADAEARAAKAQAEKQAQERARQELQRRCSEQMARCNSDARDIRAMEDSACNEEFHVNVAQQCVTYPSGFRTLDNSCVKELRSDMRNCKAAAARDAEEALLGCQKNISYCK